MCLNSFPPLYCIRVHTHLLQNIILWLWQRKGLTERIERCEEAEASQSHELTVQNWINLKTYEQIWCTWFNWMKMEKILIDEDEMDYCKTANVGGYTYSSTVVVRVLTFIQFFVLNQTFPLLFNLITSIRFVHMFSVATVKSRGMITNIGLWWRFHANCLWNRTDKYNLNSYLSYIINIIHPFPMQQAIQVQCYHWMRWLGITRWVNSSLGTWRLYNEWFIIFRVLSSNDPINAPVNVEQKIQYIFLVHVII